MIFHDPDDLIVRQAIVYRENLKNFTIKTAHSCVRCDPDIPFAVLQRKVAGITGQAVLRAVMFNKSSLRIALEKRKQQYQQQCSPETGYSIFPCQSGHMI